MNRQRFFGAAAALLSAVFSSTQPSAQQASSTQHEPVIKVGDQEFATWQEYTQSNIFEAIGLRCGLPPQDPDLFGDAAGDCTLAQTVIKSQYSPFNGLHQIPVAVHIIMHTNGQGAISDAMVQSQIEILNEDFRALTGSNGGSGDDAMIQFYLADRDPLGNPTTGITRSTNNTWFNDGGGYYNTLAWDTSRYLNIYTNQAGGALGYVPALPQAGIVGLPLDRVVCLWSAFGRNAPIGPPYDQGRTVTHEVGHYFGLYHTFDGGCATITSCYTNGDRICDTLPESSAHFGCPSTNTCSNPDPIDNYMNYTDDLCMRRFTVEQINRERCTLENYRPDLARPPAACSAALVTTRNMSPNPNVFTATAPKLGKLVTFRVTTSGFLFTTILGVGRPGVQQLDNGYFTLIDVDSMIVLKLGPLPGPIATATQLVPNSASMCGLTLYTQAMLHNFSGPFALTNAQDLRVGN